jgi:hypothetical protein
MFDCFKKQNINFVEILFTKYKLINPMYTHLIQPLFDNREIITHYNNYVSINCMAGMSMEKYKALEHPYPATMDKIVAYGYDGKQLHHMIRLEEFMSRYINGEKFEDCLISKHRDYLIRVKRNQEYNLEEARQVAKETDKRISQMKNDYMNTHEVEVNHEVEEVLNKVLTDVMRYYFSTELQIK